MSTVKLQSKKCPDCGGVEIFEVAETDLFLWESGGLIQNCFPYLTKDQRERLISGYCTPCWDKLWAEPE